MLSFEKGFSLLKRYGIPIAKTKLAKNERDALSFARKVDYPLVLKIDSLDIVHKTDKGFVIKNVSNEKTLIKSYGELVSKARRMKARINGVIVQEQCSGKEIIIGGKRDMQFGETIIFGLGGIFVEIMKDFSIRVIPITRLDAEEMIREIKGYPMLAGARGEKAVKIKAIADCLVKVSKLLEENPKIKELDINPLFVDEKGIKAVDVRVI